MYDIGVDQKLVFSDNGLQAPSLGELSFTRNVVVQGTESTCKIYFLRLVHHGYSKPSGCAMMISMVVWFQWSKYFLLPTICLQTMPIHKSSQFVRADVLASAGP